MLGGHRQLPRFTVPPEQEKQTDGINPGNVQSKTALDVS